MKMLFTHLSHLSSSATSQMLVTGLIALYMSLWFPANIPTLTFPIHLVWHIFEKAFFLGICEEFFKEQHSRTTGLETYVSSNHLCTPSPHSCLQKKKKTSITYRHLFHVIHNIVYSQHSVLGSLAAERWSAANPSEVLGTLGVFQ